MNHPKISVITIVHNGERCIREAVDSILNQTYRDFEYIIVDNNSTDDTPKILRTYAEKDKRIRVVNERQKGILFARNAGLKASNGEWVAVLDADDIALPERLKLQMECVTRNRHVILVGTGCILIDEDGNFIKEYNYSSDHKQLMKGLEGQKAFFPHSSVLYRRKAVMDLNGYSSSYAEDYDLWLRLSMQGTITSIPDALIKLRRSILSNSYNTSQDIYILHKMVALVCHLRRKNRLSDPSVMNEDEWQAFLDWTSKQMANLKVFEKGRAIREINRIRYSKEFTKWGRAIKIFNYMLSNRFAKSFLLDRSYMGEAAHKILKESSLYFE